MREQERDVFFFQAEDGIRDYKVTGVQTCALPISVLGTPTVTELFGSVELGAGLMVSFSLVSACRTPGLNCTVVFGVTAIEPFNGKIGRASCRERVQIAVDDVAVRCKQMEYLCRVL